MKNTDEALNVLLSLDNEFIQTHAQTIQKVYLALEDEKSKWVFLNRLLFNYTLKYEYIQNLAHLNSMITKEHPFITFYNRAKMMLDQGRALIWYGAGDWLKSQFDIYGNERCYNYQLFQSLSWECICDSDIQKKGTIYRGLKIIDVEELLEKYNNRPVSIVLGTVNNNKEIFLNLIKLGINEEHILEFPTQSADAFMQFDTNKQYFDPDVLEPVKDEVFFDCGCCMCETTEVFAEWCPEYKAIVAFEPEEEQYRYCIEKAKALGIKNFHIYPGGVYSYNGKVDINNQSGGSFIIEESGNVPVYALSELDIPYKVTLIKMDIEGSELEALKGAERLIKQMRPRLAICIYHKRSDPVAIADWILNLNVEYKIYCRHYSNFGLETVLYAI